MRIRRLDKIVENNISQSALRSTNDQMLFVLQDISETLAMIYDNMMEANDDGASVIPFDMLEKYETVHFETDDFKEGYSVRFLRYETYASYDTILNEHKLSKKAVFDAFGHEMIMPESSYGKKWRCWDKKPTEEEMAQEPLDGKGKRNDSKKND